MVFRDRVDAGRQLALRLAHLRRSGPVVVAVACGGVPIGAQVARQLRAPLDVVVTGAADPGIERLRGGRAAVALAGRVVVVVDEGAVSSATARAACETVRASGARRVVLAVPVLAPHVLPALRATADEVVYVEAPPGLTAVGQWYGDAEPVGDDEAVALLEQAAKEAHRPPLIDLTIREREVTAETGDAALPGLLTIPGGARLTVVFAHGTGSNRHSARNAYVATVLNRAGLGTLLVDLLTPDEVDRPHIFDIPLLARRLGDVTAWLRRAGLGPDRIGYFGASTGAAAALWAAGEPYADIAAIVSRGGRPDLALPRLAGVLAPTLLVVGSRDRVVVQLNRTALEHLGGTGQLAVVPGASHLFEEPGALEHAAALAREWFLEHASPVSAISVHDRHRPAP